MPLHNYRKAQLPAHCGTCAFHDWDSDGSTCRHPDFVTIDPHDVLDLEADGGMTAQGVAESLFEEYLSNQDWQPYDDVCDQHTPKGKPRDDEALRQAAFAAFTKKIEAVIASTPTA